MRRQCSSSPAFRTTRKLLAAESKITGGRERSRSARTGGENCNFTGECNLRARKGQGRMKAVVLAGGQEFGQCPLSRQAPRALWPMIDRPIIESVLATLRDAGIGQMAISANGRTHTIAAHLGYNPTPDVTIHYSEDTMPRGA